MGEISREMTANSRENTREISPARGGVIISRGIIQPGQGVKFHGWNSIGNSPFLTEPTTIPPPQFHPLGLALGDGIP